MKQKSTFAWKLQNMPMFFIFYQKRNIVTKAKFLNTFFALNGIERRLTWIARPIWTISAINSVQGVCSPSSEQLGCYSRRQLLDSIKYAFFHKSVEQVSMRVC